MHSNWAIWVNSSLIKRIILDGSDGFAPPEPCCESITFLSRFLLSKFAGVRRFLILFTFFTSGFFSIWSFFLYSRVFVLLFLWFLVCVCVGGGIVGRPTKRPTHNPIQPHTHSTKQRNEKQHSRMQGKWSEVKNFPCQECKRKEKSSHSGKTKKRKTG